MKKEGQNSTMTIALPSGRLFQPALNVLQRSGFFGHIHYQEEKDRHLVFTNREQTFRFIIAKPKDTPTYVECGAADMGIAGKDILLEDKKDVYELLDLGLGSCRIVLAASRPREEVLMDIKQHMPLKIATKYPNISRDYCLKKGIYGEIITLYGSIELAPQVGLADIIVDLVSTGRTLEQNHLQIIDEITSVSARLITNRISYKTRHQLVHQVIQVLRKTVV